MVAARHKQTGIVHGMNYVAHGSIAGYVSWCGDHIVYAFTEYVLMDSDNAVTCIKCATRRGPKEP